MEVPNPEQTEPICNIEDGVLFSFVSRAEDTRHAQ